MKKSALTLITALFVMSLVGAGSISAQGSDPSLVAQWHMNEGSGNIIYDNSGNGNDGTIYGASWTTGIDGSCLIFDGINDYLTVPNFQYILENFTIEAWLKSVGDPEGQPYDGFMMLGTIPYHSWNFGYNRNGNNWDLWDRSDGSWYIPSISTRDDWKYIVIIYKNNNEYVFENGTLIAERALALPIPVGGDRTLYIGAAPQDNQYFNGSIDEVAIYNRALTAAEIQAHYEAYAPPSPSPLVAHWSMDEGSGIMIYDNSGNNNHGTIHSASWMIYGAEGSALSFDGTDDFVEVPYNPSYDVITDLTVIAWMRCIRYYGVVVSRNGYPGSGYGSWNFLTSSFWAADLGNFSFPSPATDGNWHHIAVTYDYVGPTNSQVVLYVDGNMQATWNNVGGPLRRVSQIGLRIGSQSWVDDVGTANFKGVIDEVAIYNRALTGVDILDHYRQITPDNPPVADAGSDQILRCSTGTTMEVTLEGTGSYDPEDAPLTYHWNWEGGEAMGPSPTITLPLGTTTIKLVVNDGKVDSKPDYVLITIVDFSYANWPYRVPITIPNTNLNSLTDFQTIVVANTAALISVGKMQTDCDDIRFIANDGTPFAYWIESGVNTPETKIWVKVPSIPATGTATIYMYYGNPGVISVSDGDATFEFFDDFEGTTLDYDKWDAMLENVPPDFAPWTPLPILEVSNSDLHLKTEGWPYCAPGMSVFSIEPVMQPPLIMETLGNLFLNTGSDVNCQIYLSDVAGNIAHEGARFAYPNPSYPVSLRGWVNTAGGWAEVFSKERPTVRFRTKFVVRPEGTVEFYVDGVLKGVSSLKISTSISYRPNWSLMWRADYKCDKVLMRKYATVEPTVLLGLEEVNNPPVADAGPDQTVEANVHNGAQVTLDGSGSTDPDNDPLIYTWREDGNIIAGPTNNPTVQFTLTLGSHTIELIVDDGKDCTDTDKVLINVVDTTSPNVIVTLNPNSLWPPNHKMVAIAAMVTVSDLCDESPTWLLLSITSNEPQEGPGNKNYPDIMGHEIGTADTKFQLRAERLGTGTSRVYTITYQATDASGNSATTEATVTVPHDMGKPLVSSSEELTLPDSYQLFQNYPNPFNMQTQIRYQLPQAARVSLRILSLLGTEVCRFQDGWQEAGHYSLTWDGRDNFGQEVVSGIYFVEMKAAGFVELKKLTVFK